MKTFQRSFIIKINSKKIVIWILVFIFIICGGALSYYIYQKIVIENNKPSLKIVKKPEPSVKPKQPNDNYDPYHLNLKFPNEKALIKYSNQQYFIINQAFKISFLGQWIKTYPIVDQNKSFLGFKFSNEAIGLSKTISIYHYSLDYQPFLIWKIYL
ncbi:hypothetical protein [Spiroplasma chrysopicola]|uniref:Uncharacterized protein n=1 Tax=Spiroplasma chrysopicola DF-1 TaxID=1276227 RepID=R4UC07_9MOLU|nr:hypothetical protein [Spiroplasma chrysopicola]AGM25449.1 hypothetical protein SCHRY_v1c08760 [Spiroplasma chrysopicola DF-1]